MVMVVVSRGEDESSYVLEEMEVVVFESCLQRPKDVIFEGVSDEGLVMMVVEKGRRRWGRRKSREKFESLRENDKL